MITKSLDRLEETIDAENAALAARDLTAMDEFNRRKSQSLLEITRMIRSVKEGAVDPAVARRLEGLRAKLDANQTLLSRYMRAVQEISAIVSNAIQTANSDGTYTVAAGQPKLPAAAAPGAPR